MAWVESIRERAQNTVALARKRSEPPPFTAGPDLQGGTAPIVVVERAPGTEDILPRGVRTAGAWALRFILFVAAAYLLVRLVGLLRVVIIPVVVAILLAALFQPVSAALTKRGTNRSLAAGLVLIAALVLVFGGLGLIVRTFVSQLDTLTTQVSDGINEVQDWLSRGPLHLSQTQLSDYVDRMRQALTENQGALTSGALSTATTLGEVVTGFFLVLFSLFFFLRDGGQIWSFLCRLLPRDARVPTARAGHYSWHTLVAYVRATVLVAFVDAVGIGIGLAVMGIPLALPLAALVFLGAFIPVVGASADRRRRRPRRARHPGPGQRADHPGRGHRGAATRGARPAAAHHGPCRRPAPARGDPGDRDRHRRRGHRRRPGRRPTARRAQHRDPLSGQPPRGRAHGGSHGTGHPAHRRRGCGRCGHSAALHHVRRAGGSNTARPMIQLRPTAKPPWRPIPGADTHLP